jgi:heme iron utilization protein
MTTTTTISPAPTTTPPAANPTEAAEVRVRRFLLGADRGTLCTLSTAHGLDGFPVGSIVPYAVDAQGRPFVLLADLAEHSRAAEADPRASLFVAAPPEGEARRDPQASWRFNLAGHLVRLRRADQAAPHPAAREVFIDDDTDRDLWARYLERVPAAGGYGRAHGFFWWRLEPVRARLIAGFGDIHWVKGEALVRDDVGDAFAGAIAHMNEDHAGNLIEMVQGLGGVTPTHARLVAIDAGGLSIEASGPDRRFYFSFGREVDGAGIRHAVIEVLQRARRARSST